MISRNRQFTDCDVREDTTLSPHERASLDTQVLDNFEHYARFSSDRTQLFFVKVYRGIDFLGLAPVTKLCRHKSTKLLNPASRWWLVPLIGPFAHKTTYMVDTAFLGFLYASPFFCTEPAATSTVKRCVSDHLKRKSDVDVVWISEPISEAVWMVDEQYDSFSILPMVQADVSNHDSFDSYVASQTKKRRRNIRHKNAVFSDGGGSIRVLKSPLAPDDARAVYRCISQSSNQSLLCVPYSDVINSEAAFREQPQTVFVAEVDGKIVGSLSYLSHGTTFLQCHGGLDYGVSLQVNAYHQLLHASIEYAIDHGYQRLSFGPLNNETKRRAGTDLMPMVANLWSRNPFFGLFTKTLVIPNFQVYRGKPALAG